MARFVVFLSGLGGHGQKVQTHTASEEVISFQINLGGIQDRPKIFEKCSSNFYLDTGNEEKKNHHKMHFKS